MSSAILSFSSRVVTEIDADFEGDAFAPKFGAQWTEIARDPHTSSTGLGFSFVTYMNNSKV